MEWLTELVSSALNVLFSSLLIMGMGVLGAWYMSNLPDGRQKER